MGKKCAIIFILVIQLLVHQDALRPLLSRRHHRITNFSLQNLLDLFSDEYSVTMKGYTINSIETEDAEAENLDEMEIRLQDGASAWGNGEHPTTALCLNFLAENVKEGDKILDYGCGSAILSIFSVKALKADSAVAVDIDEDTLRAAETNVKLNCLSDKIDVTHTRYVYVGEDRFPVADITVANILPGPLTRLVSPLLSFSRPGGIVCLSGMRPEELPSVREHYLPYIDIASESIATADSATFGEWVAWSFKFKALGKEDRALAIERLSSIAME